MSVVRNLIGRLGVPLLFAAVLMIPAGAAFAQADHSKIVGANECGECHKNETEIWKGTHHFSTFKDLPRSKEAREIADKMGVKRIKAESLCIQCHFTTQVVKNRPRAVAGISCESCHSAGKDWLKVHSEYSGKKKETESADEAKARWAKAEAAGMIRPAAMYTFAKNCYGCHVVPQEKLVNTGGHTAGSPFELVSWSQGEVRHNMWYNGGKVNAEADANTKRKMYVVGLAVELETALRAVGKATEKKSYAVAMARRAAAARKNIGAAAAALGSVPELAAIAAAANSAGLKLNNDAELSAAADKVATNAKAISDKYDGSTFAGVDAMIPAKSAYKGSPAK